MAVADHLNTVQKIYIAFYQRPADPAGLKYWAQRLDVAGGDLTAIIDAFAGEPEAQELYGAIDEASIGAVVDAIYQALFNRAPDAAGKQFYVDGFKAGTFSAGNIALNVLNGAQNDDLVAINNKVGVANEFSAQVDGRALTDAGFGTGTSFDVTYSGAADATAARDLLKAVTSNPATVLSAAAVTEALQAQIADAGDAIGGVTSGKAFTLTAGVDELTGTSGNDTFKSGPVTADGTAATTLNGFDVINGGAGTDTLNVTGNGVNNAALVGAISNIEIINIDNRAVDVDGTAESVQVNDVDASVGGAALQQLWQIGTVAGDVTKLAATTTAGLRSTDLTTGVDVEAADGSSSMSVALDQVTGSSADGTTTATLTTDGKNLDTVTVSGTIKASDTAGEDDTVLALEVGVGVDADGNALKTVTVNSNQTTTLTLTLATATGVTAVNAAGSTGGITFDAGSLTGIATINTGAGKDVIDIDTVTAKDNAATATIETVDASVNTGAGDDIITATFSGDGKATVLAGEGNDAVTVEGLASGGTTVNVGAGNDTVDVSAVALTTKDSLVGGDGTDTLVIAGGASLVTADYLTLSAVASGFETLEVDTETIIDASQVDAQFTTLAFNAASSDNIVTKLGTQALVLKNGSSLTATTAGYVLDSDTATAGNQTTYAGIVNATAFVDSTITAQAESVALNVVTKDTADAAATGNSDVVATLVGDVKAATVSLTSTRDTDADGDATGYENLAKLVVDLDTTANSDVTLNALTTITVTGAGTVTVDASDATEATPEAVSGKLTTIDLSGMEAFLNLNADGDQTDGTTVGAYQNLSTSTVTLNDAVAETVKLGGAKDTITTASTYAKMDTIEGFTLVANTTDTTGKTADAAKSDSINLAFTGSETAWTIYKFDAAPANLSGALLEVGAAAEENIMFNFDGNTYIYQDIASATAGIDADDTLIKLTGTLDLNLLNDVVVVA